MSLRFPIFAAALAFAAPPLAAAPMAPAQLAQLVPGAEFRGYFSRGPNFENHIWRFAPDGSVRAVYTLERNNSVGTYREEGSDTGRWSLRGDRICIEWSRNILPPACYAVDAGAPPQVRLIGPPVLDGTLSR